MKTIKGNALKICHFNGVNYIKIDKNYWYGIIRDNNFTISFLDIPPHYLIMYLKNSKIPYKIIEENRFVRIIIPHKYFYITDEND